MAYADITGSLESAAAVDAVLTLDAVLAGSVDSISWVQGNLILANFNVLSDAVAVDDIIPEIDLAVDITPPEIVGIVSTR